jgi:PTH1 family peptidyl-tRNA hydrolase
MNESGYAVSNFLEGRIEPLMIILDDINLPLGKIRLRNKGSDGGHLGLRSIIKALGTTDFARLRIGVGRSMEDAASYVLDRFTREEKTILRKVLDQGIVGVEMIFKQNFVKAQNYINAVDLQDNTRQ